MCGHAHVAFPHCGQWQLSPPGRQSGHSCGGCAFGSQFVATPVGTVTRQTSPRSTHGKGRGAAICHKLVQLL